MGADMGFFKHLLTSKEFDGFMGMVKEESERAYLIIDVIVVLYLEHNERRRDTPDHVITGITQALAREKRRALLVKFRGMVAKYEDIYESFKL